MHILNLAMHFKVCNPRTTQSSAKNWPQTSETNTGISVLLPVLWWKCWSIFILLFVTRDTQFCCCYGYYYY